MEIELTSIITFALTGGIAGLVGVIWKQLNSSVKKLEIMIEKNQTGCSNYRKDIYKNYLSKELSESQRQPVLKEIEDLKTDIRELWVKIDNMNIDILTIKNSMIELSSAVIEQSKNSHRIETVLVKIENHLSTGANDGR